MPRVTFRQQFLHQLGRLITDLIGLKIRIAVENGQRIVPRRIIQHRVISRLLRLYARARTQRYLLPRSFRQRPVNKYKIDMNTIPVNGETQPWLSDEEFITAYRMTRPAFRRLLSIIQTHEVFRRKKRGPLQAPVYEQLLTLLHYLSSSGSDSGGARIRNHFHISYGCKDVYVQRCAQAIRSRMRSTYYSWPDAQEREALASKFKKEYNLPNAVLVVDGTTFRLMKQVLSKLQLNSIC